MFSHVLFGGGLIKIEKIIKLFSRFTFEFYLVKNLIEHFKLELTLQISLLTIFANSISYKTY